MSFDEYSQGVNKPPVLMEFDPTKVEASDNVAKRQTTFKAKMAGDVPIQTKKEPQPSAIKGDSPLKTKQGGLFGKA